MIGENVLENPILTAIVASILFSMVHISHNKAMEWRQKGRNKYIKVRGQQREPKAIPIQRIVIFSIILGIAVFVIIKLAEGPLASEGIEETISSVEWSIGFGVTLFLEPIISNAKSIRVDNYVKNNEESLEGELVLSRDYLFEQIFYEWDSRFIVILVLAMLTDHIILWGSVWGLLVLVLMSRFEGGKKEKETTEENSMGAENQEIF